MQAESPMPLLSAHSPPFVHCKWGTHIQKRRSCTINTQSSLVFVQDSILNIGPRKNSPNHLYGAPEYSLSQTTCGKAVFWETLLGLCGKIHLQAAGRFLLWEIPSAYEPMKSFEVLQ